jgi:uncharacterized repeat protein (TIGR03803 family)
MFALLRSYLELSPSSNGQWAYQVLYTFVGPGVVLSPGLVLDKAGNLYGTTFYGGSYSEGMVFELAHNSDGSWSESTIFSFGSYFQDGIHPESAVTFDASGNLYGTTYGGGANGQGTVFELMPSTGGEWTEAVLYSFRGAPDGAFPEGPLTLDGAGNLYGTTASGGNMFLSECELNQFNGCGIVFELTPQTGGGWTESVLYNLRGYLYGDGAWSNAGVVFDSAGNLYGTTEFGGYCEFCGILFRLSPSQDGGWTERVIERFKGSNGYNPVIGNLAFDPSGNLYGATYSGGQYNCGTVFQFKPGRRTGASYSFTCGSDGDAPSAVVFDATGRLYGVTSYGGNATGMAGNGVILEARP